MQLIILFYLFLIFFFWSIFETMLNLGTKKLKWSKLIKADSRILYTAVKLSARALLRFKIYIMGKTEFKIIMNKESKK